MDYSPSENQRLCKWKEIVQGQMGIIYESRQMEIQVYLRTK